MLSEVNRVDLSSSNTISFANASTVPASVPEHILPFSRLSTAASSPETASNCSSFDKVSRLISLISFNLSLNTPYLVWL